METEVRDFSHVVPSNVYDTYIRIEGPRPYTEQAHSLHAWLNIQHCGSAEPPPVGHVAEGHRKASWQMGLVRLCPIRLALGSDGGYVPKTLEVDGVTYDLVPRVRTPGSSSR